MRGRRRGRHMVVGFTTTCAISAITNKVVSSNPVHGEVYSIQHYVIKLVKDLRQVGGFLRVLRFPPPIKLAATMKVSLYHGIFTTDQMLECI
jgi:hypothetical protein